MSYAIILYRLPDGRTTWARVPRWQFRSALRLMFTGAATDRRQ